MIIIIYYIFQYFLHAIYKGVSPSSLVKLIAAPLFSKNFVINLINKM